ncbi:hypothetical protein [Streptomyces fagopyri]
MAPAESLPVTVHGCSYVQRGITLVLAAAGRMAAAHRVAPAGATDRPATADGAACLALASVPDRPVTDGERRAASLTLTRC